MQDIKRNKDTLTLMDIIVDFDELSIQILNDLNPSFIELSHTIQLRDTNIDFDELFEKLLNCEAQLHAASHGSSSSPTTLRRTMTFVASSGPSNSRRNYNHNNRSNIHYNRHGNQPPFA